MLYYLFRELEEFGIPGSGMWQYISFRSLLTLILSLLISMWFGEKFICWMKEHGGNETQRDASIDPYGVEKKGVPTMGGIIIVVATIIPCLLLGRLRNIYMIIMLVTTLWLAFIGFMDDFIKMKKTKDGLRPIYKLAGQAILGLVVGLTLWLSPDAVIRENITTKKIAGTEMVVHKSEPVKSTITTIPFVKGNNFDYADLFSWAGEYTQILGWIFFVLVVVFVLTAVSNGANLTDGLDGLSTGVSAIIGITLGILAYLSGHIEFASYLNIMYIPNSEELVIFICAFVGALIGFLWYNAYPAQVFMGDTGSLMIGGVIAVISIIIRKELLLPILCGVFFVESVSVIIQTTYFKYTKKKYGEGRRVFLMAPLHHHYQKKNIPESKIVARFWIVSILLAVLTIVTLKIR